MRPSLKISAKFSELLRLLLLVASAAAVALAGSLSNASASHYGFAREEISQSEELLSALTERLANEASDEASRKIEKQLSILDRRISDCRRSLALAQKQPENPLTQEHLRASVMLLNEASTLVLNTALDADSQKITAVLPGRSFVLGATSSK